jgi:uncharacterized protein YprB with RNaseH-like and TPR domain
MKLFHAVSKGFDTPTHDHVARGTVCAIRIDSTGDIRLVSANGRRFDEPGLKLKSYELHEYFTLGHSAPSL